MTLKKKLVLVLVVVVGTFVVVSGLIAGSIGSQRPGLDGMVADSMRIAEADIPLMMVIKDIQIDIIQVQQWLSDISATRGMGGLDDGFDQAEAYAQKFAKDVEKARKLAQSAELDTTVAALNRIEREFLPYYTEGKKMAQTYVTEGPFSGNEMMPKFDAVAARLDGATADLVNMANSYTQEGLTGLEKEALDIRVTNDTIILTTVIFGVLGLFFAAGGALIVYRAVSTSLEDLQTDLGALTDLASANDDTEKQAIVLRLDNGRNDEFGLVGKALRIFEDNIREGKRILAAQMEQAARLNKSKRLETLTANFGREAEAIILGVGKAAESMRQTAETMTKTAKTTGDRSIAVSSAATQASSNVESVAQATELLGTSIDEIGRQVVQSAKIAEQAVQKTNDTNHSVQGLAEAAKKIGDIVNLINEIAGQTNLLALNATIEAARAGEAGKGFAVVAGEVKNLANQTSRATEEISAQISAIQEETAGTVAAIEDIGGIISEINDIATTIASAVKEQTKSTRDIADNVRDAARGTGEVSRNIQDVSEAAQETGTASADVLSSSKRLAHQADTLREQVANFMKDIRSA
ncbi:MAG: methyl-accepting chemotaxis protein [Alphaproteobacteria bacterium]|nr:methyl-accepting chemotaxis protein [Alphaproteobacteria bacterium]